MRVWISPGGRRTHAADGLRTLCGVEIRSGWSQDTQARYVDESYVDCRRCRRSLEQPKP